MYWVKQHDTTIVELVFLPNQHFHRTLVEMVHVDQVQRVYNDNHLYCMDAQVDSREQVV